MVLQSGRQTVYLFVGVLVISSLAIGVTASFGSTATTPDEGEPNDDRGTATAIDAGETVNGSLDAGGDVDWYAVDATAGDGLMANLTLTSESANQSVEVTMYDPDGNRIGHQPSDGMGGPFNVAGYTEMSGYRETAEIADVAETTGTYYVRVDRSEYDSEPGDVGYALEVDTTELDEYDPNENTETATNVALGEPIEAVIAGYDTDVYAVTIPAGSNVTATVDVTKTGPFRFTKDLVVTSSPASDSEGRSDTKVVGGVEQMDAYGQVTFTAAEGGTYYLHFGQGGDNSELLQTEHYTLTVETSPGDGGTDDGSDCPT